MAKKKEIKNIEELLGEALITKEEQPYEIPSNWEWVKIESITTIKAGGDVPKQNFSKEKNVENTIPIYANGESNEGLYGFTNEPIILEPSVTISARGTIGYSQVRMYPFYPIVRLICLTPKNKSVDANLLNYYTKTVKFENTGSSIPQLTIPTIKEKLIFPLPPLSEQTRIVNKLESMISKLKEAKEKIAEAKESFELRRASILHKAFTGELTKKWRIENKKMIMDGAESLLEKINEEKIKNWEDECKKSELEGKKKPSKPKLKTVEEMKVSDEEKPYDLPQGWEWLRLGDLSKFINGDRGKNYPSSAHYVDNGIAFISAGNIKNNHLDYENLNYISEERFDLLGSGKVEKDDILYCLRGSLGKFALINQDMKGAIASSLMIIRANVEDLTKWIVNYLSSSLSQKMISTFENGTAQPNLSATNVADFLMPLPPLSEQQEIVARIEALLKAEEDAKDLLNMEEQIDLLEKSILSKAFRGELGTNDSSDEPALELLKRVLGE